MPIISSLALSCVWLNNFYSILQNCYYNMGLQVIAKRLLESKQNTPHLYLSTGAWILALHVRIKNSIRPLLMYLTFFLFFWLSDVILDPLLSLRKDLKGLGSKLLLGLIGFIGLPFRQQLSTLYYL